jgi:N-methylhydantoinase A
MRIGVDVGGTFTDFVLLSKSGLSLHKISSTPADPASAVIEGLGELRVDLGNVSLFAHGTTVTTNAVIQRRGARTGLLTTKGFRDVLQIRRTTRGKLYDFQWDPPSELVPREWRREVRERTSSSGEVTQEPDVEGAIAQVMELVHLGIESLAICFLNAYLNPRNEHAVREAVRQACPELPVYISSEILPEWREFERTSTTTVSAYVGPILTTYLRHLEGALQEGGYRSLKPARRSDLMVMLSNGGLAAADAAIYQPAYTLGSGPAAGVIAQLALAEATGMRNLIGMDIGGTSTDVSLVYGGSPYLKSEFELEFGTVVSYPVIDIDSIGAGGGTIAWADEGGLLHAGPQSAGAVPGPACMQRGGEEPTVTDAHVLLQRLNPRYLLGGRIPISRDAAREVIMRLGKTVGLDPIDMARGILTLTSAHIVHSIRQRTVERGLDPREFAIVAYGGAGPLHATDVASELGISSVLIPRSPGVTSALGLLFADIRHDFVTTVLQLAKDVSPTEIGEAYGQLVGKGRTRLETEGVPPERMRVLYSMDLRYEGQTHELLVQLPGAYSAATHNSLSSLLRDVHMREFGHAPQGDEPIEIVNLRVACLGELGRPGFPEVGLGPEPRPREEREVFFHQGWARTPIYDREAMHAGSTLCGPAVVEQLDSTTVIPPGWVCEADTHGNLILRQERSA